MENVIFLMERVAYKL